MSESHLLSSSLEGVGYLSSGKRVYMQHLVAASERVTIGLADNVLEVSGKLLFNRDELVQPGSLFRLMQIPTETALTHLFNVRGKESTDWLLNDFQQLIQDDPLLSAIDESVINEKVSLDKKAALNECLVSCLSAVEAFPALQQHLTLLSLELPKTYWRTLYCALLSLLLAKEMHLTVADVNAIFLAALGHDLGMLMVNPLVLNKSEKLDADDWRQIQQHLPSSVVMLHRMPDFPESAVQAVLEHHERCDGTGYPSAKVESEISLLGQILGLTDSLAAIYFNRFKHEGRSLRDAAAIIQLNQQAYLHRSFELISAILKRGEMPIKNVIANDNSAEFINQLTQKNQFLFQWFQLLSDCLLSLGFRHGDRQLHGLQNVIIHLATSVRGGGLFEGPALRIESSTPVDVDEVAKQLESVAVMQQELLFHLQRLSRMIQIYLDSDEKKDLEIENKLRAGFEKVLALHKS
jgi:HD-GYP domain-containing protein (c-di-GMP phosphodiesterase class II)